MAPPKTMVLSQQQHQVIGQQQHQGDQAGKQGKQRKRKANNAKQQQSGETIKDNLVEKQQVDCDKRQDISTKNNNKENIAPTTDKVTELRQQTVVPSERTTIKNPKQQVLKSVEAPILEKDSKVEAAQGHISPPDIIIGKHQQISNEEVDDIDAGIELDGSSNSGSSVKDMNEDQIKSASVSPVMVRGDLVNETCTINQVQPAVGVSPVEQLTSVLCSSTSSAKKMSTTKEQLAANQQVIDADEKLLQEKLQSKQKKGSEDKSGKIPATSRVENQQQSNSELNTESGQISKSDKPAPLRRRFSSQSSQESQDGLVCKICEQHVYQMERMLAEKAVYHKRCFRCHQCKIQLRVDNYSSHEGQVYCKAHHRQIFQPQVKLDNNDDVDIVTKSKIRQRQLIICENEPAELPKDVVRSDTKLDDGIGQLNLNLNNILEKFERGTANSSEESQPSSAGVVFEKPSFNIKQTLLAFESRMANQTHDDSEEAKRSERATERPVVKKLTNLNGFLHRQDSIDTEASAKPLKPLAVRRSESLMQRLKKYESRIAGEQVDDDSSDDEENDSNNNNINGDSTTSGQSQDKKVHAPKKLTSLKKQWENGDINKRRVDEDFDEVDGSALVSDKCNGNSTAAEKNEELSRIRQQLARRKSGEACSVKNIYENAIREAQLQQRANRSDSSDLSALNGLSTANIQQLLLQNNSNGSIDSQNMTTPTTPNKDHFQLNLHNRANKLKEKFELGLITNSSHDDSDVSDSDAAPALTKLEQIRQEKMEDLSIFTEGEVKAREARNIFQQIDRRISAASGSGRASVVNSRSLASIGASMRTKLTNQMNAKGAPNQPQQQPSEQQPIRLTNNVRT